MFRRTLGRALGALLLAGMVAIAAAPASAESPKTASKLGTSTLGPIQSAPVIFTSLMQPVEARLVGLLGAGGAAECGAGGCTEGCGEMDCGGDCCRPCCPCGPSGRFWVRADYLMWWSNGQDVPPLVTTSSQAQNGILGQSSTQTLFGGRTYGTDIRHGYRIRFGGWLDECRLWGLEADFLDLGQDVTSYSNSSTGDPLLARPIYDILTDQEGSQIISKESTASGSVDSRVAEDFLGAGVGLRRNLRCFFSCDDGCGSCEEYDCEELGCGTTSAGSTCWRLDLIGGYRHYRLQNSVDINEFVTLTTGQGGNPAGTTFDVRDSFSTRNEFHGGELGLVWQGYRDRWSFEMMAKVGLGNNRQTVDIQGQTIVTVPGNDPVTHSGGLLALDTNIGSYQRDRFVVIPHFGFELGYELNCCSRVFVGYEFLLWTDVVRAGDQIDRVVNTNYIPPIQTTPTGPQRPAFDWNSSEFWAQSITLGYELRR